MLWLELSYAAASDDYAATVTADTVNGKQTWPVGAAEGRSALLNSTLLGFVEGNSVGRISAQGVSDPPTQFNGWRRQEFDQPTDLSRDGGRVWEHWCTTRDIRRSSRIGTSVLSAYVALVARLGNRFPAAVARGRSDYAHPVQLAAMVRGGFIGADSALTDLAPTAIPVEHEQMLLQATPGLAVQAARTLDWSDPPRYYMFARRIDRWCPTAVVREALDKFRGP